MSGEDVYDVARNWCHVCNADHPDCDPSWLDDLHWQCVICHEPIEDEDEEVEVDGMIAHDACRLADPAPSSVDTPDNTAKPT